MATTMLIQWLTIWSFQANEIWSGTEFFTLMLSPILLYIAAHILISPQPESITSWSAHLKRVARPLLMVMMLMFGPTFILRNLLISEPEVRTGLWIFLLMMAVLLITNVVTLIFPKRSLLAATAIVWLVISLRALSITELT